MAVDPRIGLTHGTRFATTATTATTVGSVEILTRPVTKSVLSDPDSSMRPGARVYSRCGERQFGYRSLQ